MPAWAIIREARARAGLTQRALAERAGKAQSEIAKIERGRRDPTVSTLERLVRAAGFDLKIQFVPHDPHDEQLVALHLRLTPGQRLAGVDEFNEFLASARIYDGRDGGIDRSVQARPLLEKLVAHKVQFIAIGGIAEILLGAPRMTSDVDVCAASNRLNLTRLAEVLSELGTALDAKTLSSSTNVAVVTEYGPLDVWFRPKGTHGYDDLIKRALDLDIDGMRIKVAHIDDIIRNKEAIATMKYLAQLPLLRELREQLQKQD